MDSLARLVLIVLGITLAGLVGYVSRRAGWVAERSANSLMFKTVIFGWAPTSVFAVWRVGLEPSLVALPTLAVFVPLCLVPIGFGLARLHRLDPLSAGTFVVSSMISNIGVTMGAFVCYCLFGADGLGYAMLYCTAWVVPYIMFAYPIARRFGEPDARVGAAFVFRTLLDRRSLPVLGSLIGLALNLGDVAFPEFISRWWIVDVFLIGSVLMSFFTIGLQLHFAHLADKVVLHVTLGLVKFIAAPIITLLLIPLIRLAAGPMPSLAWKVAVIEGTVPVGVYAVVTSNLFALRPRLASMLFFVNTVVFLALVLPILTVIFR